MKRILSMILVTVLCISLFTCCTQSNEDEAQFDFSYSVERVKYTRGETIQITATVKNVSGKTYKYEGCSGNDFIPQILLYSTTNRQYQIACDPIVLPEDVVAKKIPNGESGSIVYSFQIPKDATLGSYSLTLALGKDQKEFTDILSIIELTSQNETEKYQYSTMIVSSGDSSIKPIECFLSTTQYKNGTPLIHGDGGGVYMVFSDSDTDISEFPVLVYDGNISVSTSADVTILGIYVYDTAFRLMEYKIKEIRDLTTLPSGDYLIVLLEYQDATKVNPEILDYWLNENECLFRFTIP